MTDIPDLKRRVSELRNQLHEAERALYDARCALTGLSIGDVVESKGKRYRVTKIDPGFGVVWASGNPELKAGGWGTSVRCLYSNWTKVQS